MNKAALCAVALLLSLPRAFAAETVTIAVGEWPPYTSKQDPNARIAQQIASAAFAQQGIQVKYAYYPWKRCYAEVRAGHVAATLPWFRSGKRDKAFLFSQEPLTHNREVFFYLKPLHFHWGNYGNLKQYRIGATLGYYDTDLLAQQGLPLDKVSDERLNFEKMLVGRIDIYATGRDVGTYLINTLFPPATAARFTYDPKPLHEANTFVMFSRKRSDSLSLRDRFDRGLRALKASGRYDAIFRTQRQTDAMTGLREEATASD